MRGHLLAFYYKANLLPALVEDSTTVHSSQSFFILLFLFASLVDTLYNPIDHTFTMKFSSILLNAALAATAVASPTPLEKRAATTMCQSWGSLATGAYTVYQNNWGAAQATSGSQCTTFTSLSSAGSVAWSTSWSWAGGAGQVKSYANVALEKVNKKLSAIKSIPSTWTWRYVVVERPI